MTTNADYKFLKESPMFHFSLHAKELFHSNFLAWLGMDLELRPVFKTVMKALGVDGTFIDSWGDDFEVLREKDNFDLVVKASDGLREAKCRNAKEQIVPGKWYVVVENKIKSIPNERQLKEYTEKCHECNEKLLLVISGSAKGLNYGWRRVNYTQVVDALKESLALVTNDYKRAIIADYINMVETLISIVEKQEVSMTSNYIFTPSKELDDLRIADLVDKWRIAQIADMYTKKTGLKFNSGYTNKQPLIETYFDFNGMKLGIQIQGRQYRHYIIRDTEIDIADVSKGFLSNTRVEFRNAMLLLHPGIFEDKAVKGEQNRKYCSYDKDKEGATFWYQYVIIEENVTIEQIMNCAAKDMQILYDALEK